MSEHERITAPKPIPRQAPGGFAATEPLPDMIRRIVREELRPIHLMLEELRERPGRRSDGRS